MVIPYAVGTIECLVFKAARVALGPTESTDHCVPVFISDGVKPQGREGAVHFHLMPTRILRGSRPPSPHLLSWFCGGTITTNCKWTCLGSYQELCGEGPKITRLNHL